MSASNWAECPNCEKEREKASIELQDKRSQELKDKYGNVSQEEYNKLKQDFEEQPNNSESDEDIESLREDYEQGVDDNGMFILIIVVHVAFVD